MPGGSGYAHALLTPAASAHMATHSISRRVNNNDRRSRLYVLSIWTRRFVLLFWARKTGFARAESRAAGIRFINKTTTTNASNTWARRCGGRAVVVVCLVAAAPTPLPYVPPRVTRWLLCYAKLDTAFAIQKLIRTQRLWLRLTCCSARRKHVVVDGHAPRSDSAACLHTWCAHKRCDRKSPPVYARMRMCVQHNMFG